MGRYTQLLTLIVLLVAVVAIKLSMAPAPEPHAAHPRQAAVASAHPMATEAGLDILAAGGNAFDAAVAVSATLAVVEPYSSGMGGGGFWLLHRASDAHTVMIDGRERAPLAAHRDMYLDADGRVIPGLSVDGPLAAGIPGQAAALVHLAERYGRLPLKKTLAPAIAAARKGFPVTPHYRRMAQFRLEALRASPEAAAIFLHDNEVPPLGHVIRQPDLAASLKLLAAGGRDVFYDGPLAQALVEGVREAGGIWQLRDLREYTVVERRPIVFDHRGYRITSVPPPSSGGVALATLFNILDGFDLDALPPVTRVHLKVEAMRRAYYDRARYLGDSDVVDVPVARLVSPQHAEQWRAGIRMDAATPSTSLGKGEAGGGGFHTTHFSILDTEGNRVAATLSINYPFGSGFVAPGTGILLNDEMDDFSARPGTPNVYGLVGGEANAIAPGKRMLSSMSPTFVESDQRLAILGTPGGSRIITMVFHGINAFIDGGDATTIVTTPRYHHQYLPDLIQYEPDAFDADTIAELRLLGHELKPVENGFGNMQAVVWEREAGEITAASDPRGEGTARVR